MLKTFLLDPKLVENFQYKIYIIPRFGVKKARFGAF